MLKKQHRAAVFHGFAARCIELHTGNIFRLEKFRCYRILAFYGIHEAGFNALPPEYVCRCTAGNFWSEKFNPPGL